MRKTKEKQQCELCGRHEELNYVNVKYFKVKICETCLKWYATLLYNTVLRFEQVMSGGTY